MGEDEKERIIRHLREMKAKSKAKSFDSLFRRIWIEQEFRKILASLEQSNIFFREILPSLVLKGNEGGYFPDFIIWKEDISIPLFLTESSSENQCAISQGEVQEYVRYLRKTGSSEMAVSWMIPNDFPCKIISVEELDELMKTGRDTFSFKDLSPFKQTIMEFMKQQSPVWPVQKLKELPRLERPESLIQTLKSTLDGTFRRELRKRRPLLAYKRKALQNISKRDLDSIVVLVERYFETQVNGNFVRHLRNLVEKSVRDDD